MNSPSERQDLNQVDRHADPSPEPNTTGRATLALSLIFGLSFTIYMMAIALPYNLLSYAPFAPTSMPEIADREREPAAIFLLAFLALFMLYGFAYHICRQYPNRKLVRWILIYGLVLAMPLVLTYPIGAGDVVDYVSHGEVLAYHGVNPLVVPPADVPDTTLTPYSAYRFTTSNYGPLWIWISGLVVRLAGRSSLVANLIGFKAVSMLAYLVQAAVIYTFFRRRDPTQAPAALLFFTWNPLVLYEYAANGHNDATMMALVLLGILYLDLGRPLLMTIALTLSLLIKIPTAPLLPIFLLAAARHAGHGRRRAFWTSLIGNGLLAAGLIGLLYVSLPDTLGTLSHLSKRSGLFTHSLPTLVEISLQLAGLEEAPAKQITLVAALLALGACYAVQLRRTWRRPQDAHRSAYTFILFFLLFAVPWFQPWYVTWLIGLAALAPRPHARLQASLFSLTVMSSYVVYGFVWFWIVSIANWGNFLGIHLIGVATTYLIPWGYTAWVVIQDRRRRIAATLSG